MRKTHPKLHHTIEYARPRCQANPECPVEGHFHDRNDQHLPKTHFEQELTYLHGVQQQLVLVLVETSYQQEQVDRIVKDRAYSYNIPPNGLSSRLLLSRSVSTVSGVRSRASRSSITTA